MRCFVLALCLFATEAKNDKADCADLVAKVASLEKKLREAETRIASLQNDGDNVISVTGVISHASTMAGETVQHLFDQTNIDDQVYDKIGAAKAMTVDFMGKASSIDYNAHWDTLTQHDVYKTHIAPTMDVVHKKAQPYMQEYVNPALKQAQDAVNPALATATKHVNENMMPVLQRQKTMVYEHVHLSGLESKLAKSLDPVYNAAGKISPKLARVLPTDTWDRILLLVIAIISFYYFLSTTYFLSRKAFWMTTKTTSLALRLLVVLPLWLMWKTFWLLLCLTTCGFCCGLCGRRHGKENGKAATNGKANGKDHGKDNGKAAATNGSPKKVTEEEINELLQASRKKGKVEDAAKLLVTHAKNGKPLEKNFPENVKNKVVDAATLKKAFGKAKDVDAKKLGL